MLVAENISKKFAGVTALDNVCLELHAGKVNAIIGENGAGKSTLMKILSGVYTDFEGRILFNGKPLAFKNTRDALASGIAIIHQELNLIPYLSITENIFLGYEITSPLGLLRKTDMRKQAQQLLAKLKLDVDAGAPVASLKVGQQQVVEIAKALLHDAAVIIMDEPTSALGDKEVKVLFELIEGLKKEGKIIVYISHKLDELFAIADRYIVLRDGKSIESGDLAGMSREGLVKKMVGRDIVIPEKKNTTLPEGELLSVNQLSLKNAANKNAYLLQDISFSLKKGEVLGIFGLMGAGRTELLESIFGLRPGHCEGTIKVNGATLNIKSPAAAAKAGIALVPEDRKKDGLVTSLPVRDNISITTLPQLQTMGLLDGGKETALADKYIGSLKIKTPSQKQLVKNLSGGNQQKIVLAKWLATKPCILMLDEPTRGIDINAKSEIYKLVAQLAEDGMGIIVVSSEMPELLAVSGRVLVMCEGRITAGFSISEATEHKILSAAIPKNN